MSSKKITTKNLKAQLESLQAHRQKQVRLMSKVITDLKISREVVDGSDISSGSGAQHFNTMRGNYLDRMQEDAEVSYTQIEELKEELKIKDSLLSECDKKIEELMVEISTLKSDRQLAEKIVEVAKEVRTEEVKKPIPELPTSLNLEDFCLEDDEIVGEDYEDMPDVKPVKKEEAAPVIDDDDDEQDEDYYCEEEEEEEDYVTYVEMNQLIKEINEEKMNQENKIKKLEQRLLTLENKAPELDTPEGIADKLAEIEEKIDTFNKGSFLLNHIDFQGPKVKKIHNLNIDSGMVDIRFSGPTLASAPMEIEKAYELVKADMEILKTEQMYVELEGEIAGNGKAYRVAGRKFTIGTVKKVKRQIGSSEMIAELVAKKEDANGEKHILTWEILGDVSGDKFTHSQRREQMWETYDHEGNLEDVQVDYI